MEKTTKPQRFNYVDFASALIAPAPYTPTPNFPPPALTPLRRPIAQSKIGLVTLAGVQRRDEQRLGETNDLSYRIIRRGTPFSDLFVAHTTAVRVFALEDLNVVYPHDRLIELEAEGTIGSFAERTVSMVGSITRYGALVDETVPKIHAELEQQGVDLAILIPL
jgi:D-proline reductase (dithiol) PrdB